MNKIPSDHPQGNKPSFAGGGPMGRAAMSQQSSGGGFQGGAPYQGGAPPAPKSIGTPPKAPPSHSNAFFPPQEKQANADRLRTKQTFGLPAMQRRMGK